MKNKKLILLAEDNFVNQEVISMQLSALGYDAMLADDGREALELWKKHSFDIVLTDCHMPEMDGFELAIAIREAETTTGAHVPIIAVTANAMSEELKRCLDSGMDDCLTKPLEMVDLDLALNKWLSTSVSPSADAVSGSVTSVPETEPVSESNQTQAVNPQVLAQLTGMDIEECKFMMMKFIDASTPIIDAITAAAEESRFDEVTAQAHKLKSSAKTVGAETLTELCLNMEQAGKDKAVDNMSLMSSNLRDEFDRVKRYIDELT